MSLGIGPLGGAPLGGGTTYAVASGPAHTYWRLLAEQNAGVNVTVIAELKLKTSAGGAQAATGGVASASGYNGTDTPDKAFDGNTATLWASANATGQRWLQYRFASPVEIVEYDIVPASGSFGNAPQDWVLQWSDNGNTWTTVAQESARRDWGQYPSGRTFYVDRDGAFRYWRLNVSTNNGAGYISVGEFALRLTPGGANEASGGQARANDYLAFDYRPDNVFDGAILTPWAAQGAANKWVGYRFPTGKNITEVSITEGQAPDEAPNDFTIEYSADGVTWFVAGTFTDQTWASNETKTFTVAVAGGGAAASSRRKPRPWQAGSRRGNSYKL